MKKLLSVLLVLTMLVSACALAAGKVVGVTMQPYSGLDMIPMEDRHIVVDEEIRDNLQWAYEEIHATGHYSDMKAEDKESAVFADINRVIADMGLNLSAYDYMIYDSFELDLQDQYAAMVGNGNALEVKFDLNLDRSVNPVVMLSNDQASWECIEAANVVKDANGDLTVRFDELGTVLVLIEVKYGAGSINNKPGNFTPSVSGKPAPDVVPPQGAAAGIVARIYNELSEMICEVPDMGYLVITPVSRRDTAEDKEVRERLEWAYNQIQTTPRIGDLPAEGTIEGIAPAIDKVLKDSGYGTLTSDDMIVRDLFDATLYGTEYVDNLNDDGHYIEITFDLGVDPHDPLVILVTNDNKTWQAVEFDNYVINADGSVTVYLEELGTIAMLVDSRKQEIDPDNSVKAPKTGE